MRLSRSLVAPALFAILLTVSCARIISTYWTFNHTIDEPTHIACGLEWFQRHAYTYEYQHPPLSRVFAAFGPWLRGTHNISKKEDLPAKNPLVLYQSDSYYGTLVSARAGELIFFILAAIIVYKWSRRLYGDKAAVASAFLFMSMPAVLGHSGLATTDASLMATLPMALYALDLWLYSPTFRRSCVLGLAIAAGLLSKFSFVLFFPACAAVIVLCRFNLIRSQLRNITPANGLCNVLAMFIFALTFTWGCYWFSITRVPVNEGRGGILASLPGWVVNAIARNETIDIPLGEVYLGLVEVREHNLDGHRAYLLGETETGGWWYFFPVVLFYKTPLAFWFFLPMVLYYLRRTPAGSAIPLLCALAILLVVLPSRINLGIRHILPVYPLMAISSGFAVHRIVAHQRVILRGAGILLAGWLVWVSAFCHPDYIAYFNELAFGEPESIRVDSDLDWGQNTDRLARRVKAKGISDPIGLALFGSINPSWHQLNWYPASPWTASQGWIAISLTEKMMSDHLPTSQNGRRPWAWLDRYQPVERIGNSILLYNIDPKQPR